MSSRSFRNTSVAIAVVLACAGTGLILAASAAVAVPTAGAALHDDFNGDGYADLAIGAPKSNNGGGAVSVLHGSAGGFSTQRKQVVALPDPEGSDTRTTAFGTALQSADVDGDGYADLISPVHYSSVGMESGWRMAITWGGPQGLSAEPERIPYLPPGSWNDVFQFKGATVGDLDGDGHPDLALLDVIGTGDETERHDVTIMHGPFSRDEKPARISTSELGADVAVIGPAAAGDVNGDGVDDLAMGTQLPGERDPRGVTLLTGGSAGLTERSALKDAQGNVIGGEDIEIGDLDKDGYEDIVVGHSIDHYESDAWLPTKGGAVAAVYGGPGGLSTTRKPVWINQATTGVPGTAERGDGMGSAMSIGDTNGDGYPDVATGLPGEDLDSVLNAGSVLVLKGGASGLTGSGAKVFSQRTSGVPGTAESQDRFASETALADGDGDKKYGLVVGDPDENAGKGAVWVFAANSTGITTTGSFSFGGATLGAPSTAARFGASLAE
ncbi:FG-GAP repeat protein [Streptomyces sp. ISL-98]|uniref:FG-GAP-like repeat-containing protein n=1 Tax=Streptomyces sp. ISL-98 TaxID=2819192 RepID=UPI001BEBF71F|nr:FG-GAP-like repeat-containing protein [Streptomyces sp. ISL-98]MBT2507711.1 FG-GAP repeat protein [Streptomyces sp. ISL-98]